MARKIECPFIITDFADKKGTLKLSCECGKLTFPDKESFDSYIQTYCSDEWKHCTIAGNLLEYYDRKE